MRHVLHADLDAFYAAVEQLDNPELRGRPVMVGRTPRGQGGSGHRFLRSQRVWRPLGHAQCVLRCDGAPRALSCRPGLAVTGRYPPWSWRFFANSPTWWKPLSLDEAYLDVTEAVEGGKPPLAVALDLKQQVRQETGLVLSVGVATNKSVAKIASDLRKPDGLVVVPPGAEADFLAPLPVGKLYGIGPKTAGKLDEEGVKTIGQLAAQSMAWFTRHFGQRAGLGTRQGPGGRPGAGAY